MRLAPPLLLAAGLGCNDPGLVLIDSVARKGVSDRVSSGGRTAIDVLWVIDNSGSMCQEQKNLIENFRTFVTGLSELDADIKMGVVTTDMADPEQSGRFQNRPAKDFQVCVEADAAAGVYYCNADGDCGEGGCLCGIPHLRRCEADPDCPEGQACVTSGGGSQVRFCSAPCATHADCQRALTAKRTDALTCGLPPDRPAGDDAKYCLLRVCTADFDCVTQEGYRCVGSAVPDDGPVSYCRQFTNLGIGCVPGQATCPLGQICRDDRTCPPYAQCPAPTCDCPVDLPKTVDFRAGRVSEEVVEAAVRHFRCLATVGTSGDPIEKGLGAVWRTLSGPLIAEDHPDFPRPNAHLVVVILSDEDDCTGDEKFFEGSEAQCTERGNLQCVWCRDELEDVVGIADFLKSRKRAPYQVAVAAIVGNDNDTAVLRPKEPDPSCSSDNGVAFAGSRYAALAGEFGQSSGVVESICSDSFEGPLERIATLVVSLAKRFCLTAPIRRCWGDSDCSGGATCRYFWGESGQCKVGTSYTGEACTRDADCPAPGAECDDRRHCMAGEGRPTAVEVRVHRGGAQTYDVLPGWSWSLVPSSTWGCLRFLADDDGCPGDSEVLEGCPLDARPGCCPPEASPPGPDDSLHIRYTSSVVQ